MIATVENYVILFFVCAFIGWCMEVICQLYSLKRFVNRGFLIGPYCPIYGVGSALITALLSRYTGEPVTVFVLAVVLCGTLEYLTSYFMEKLFHARWWDYSSKKFNINGRVCAETLIPFGLLGLAMIYGIKPLVFGMCADMPGKLLHVVCAALVCLILADFVISTTVLGKIRKTAQMSGGDDTEAITRAVRDMLRDNWLSRRLLKAFPQAALYNDRLSAMLREKKDEFKGEIERREKKFRAETEALRDEVNTLKEKLKKNI